MLRKIQTCFAASFLIFGIIGCSNSSSSVSPKEQQDFFNPDNETNVKYYIGMLWQDTPDNISKTVDYQGAVQYCKNLRIFESDKWRLPSGYEIGVLDRLDKSTSYFNYEKKNRLYYTESLTTGYDSCTQEHHNEDILTAPISLVTASLDMIGQGLDALQPDKTPLFGKKSCMYLTNEYNHFEIYKKEPNTKGLVRCVLNKDDYIDAKRKLLNKMNNLRKQKTFDAYLSAFRYTKDLEDIQKAYALASTFEQKLQAERLLVETLPHKIFDIHIKTADNRNIKLSSSDASSVITDATSRQSIDIDVTLSSEFLEYGEYDVTVAFTITTVYHMISSVLIVRTEHDMTQTSEKKFTFRLSPRNHYTVSKRLHLSDIVAYSSTSMGKLAGGSYQLKDLKVSAKVTSAAPVRNESK